MASDLSKYFGNAIVRWLGGNAMPTAPADVFIALFNGDPKSTGVEVTTTVSSAGRIAMDWTVPAAGNTGTANVMQSSADVDFGDSEGETDISHIAIFDAASAGNLIASKALVGGTIDIPVGTGVKFEAGDVVFTIGS